MKVVIGMSGGVDSTIAAYLLKKNGYEVIGVTMCTDSTSLSMKKDIEDAKSMCDKLSIEHKVVNVEKDFKKEIIDRFVDDYTHGITPPPCNICNGKIKFKMLLDKKIELDADKIASGHYAGVSESGGRYSIRKSKNEKKDQSYMLYSLTQEELRDLILPIGDMNKDDIRDIARELDLDVSEKKDSEDLCFIKDIDYKEYIKRYYLGDDYQYRLAKGELTEKEILDTCSFLKKGRYVDKSGNVLGYHEGIINYTIGQRKGLNIAFGDRKFVLDIDYRKNEVVLGDNDDLYSDSIVLNIDKDFIWQKIDGINGKINCTVKVRYRDSYHPCVAYIEDGKVCIKCEEKIRAITKGQVAACFDGDDILCGGIIS